ncbi:DUF4465 domain-containing protein [Porphyromonas loveana]|uniref:DUF4465 domain-containing protein n=1 Tax=Porphyromonas loveana TaxID=1884669 RepID=UPI00359F1A31
MRKQLLAVAVLFAASATAQNAFVLTKTDGSTVDVTDSALVEGASEAWTLAGNTLALGDQVVRLKATSSARVINFEDCTFATGKHNNIVTGANGVYESMGATFKNLEKYGMFSGVVVSEQSEVSDWQSEYPGTASSNKVITTDASLPAGANGSAKYALFRYDSYVGGTLKGPGPEFAFAEGTEEGVTSVMLNNTADTWQNCKIGYYSNPGLAEGDYFEVVFTGYNAAGETTGSVTYALADYRDGKTYICNEWTKVDLSALGKVNKVAVTSVASQGFTNIFKKSYGLCVDDIVVQ